MSHLRRVLAGVVFAVATACSISSASAVSLTEATLPYPGDGSGAVFGTFTDANGDPRDAILLDGIPVAFRYDDLWSYSTKVLNALQGAGFLPAAQFGNYDPAAGTGTLDLVLYVQSGGTNNQDIGPDGNMDFPDPTPSPTGGGPNMTLDDVWPNGDTATVGQVLDYLHAFDPTNNTPVFTLDLNQTGNGPEVFITAEFLLCTDAACTDIVEFWSLDALDNDAFDPLETALAFGKICFGVEADCGNNAQYLGPTDSGNTYTLDHNKGAGTFDFAAFAPTMILSNYSVDLFFRTHFIMTGLNDGAETVTLSGRVGPPSTTTVPEPGTLALFGAGLLGLAVLFRRKLAFLSMTTRAGVVAALD